MQRWGLSAKLKNQEIYQYIRMALLGNACQLVKLVGVRFPGSFRSRKAESCAWKHEGTELMLSYATVRGPERYAQKPRHSPIKAHYTSRHRMSFKLVKLACARRQFLAWVQVGTELTPSYAMVGV